MRVIVVMAVVERTAVVMAAIGCMAVRMRIAVLTCTIVRMRLAAGIRIAAGMHMLVRMLMLVRMHMLIRVNTLLRTDALLQRLPAPLHVPAIAMRPQMPLRTIVPVRMAGCGRARLRPAGRVCTTSAAQRDHRPRPPLRHRSVHRDSLVVHVDDHWKP